MSVNAHTGRYELQCKAIDGLQIRFAVGGKKGGVPILLLSQWPESIYAFLPTWEIFTTLGSVVAVDLPGFGGSQSRPDVIAPEAMGAFVLRILDAFGLRQPHVSRPTSAPRQCSLHCESSRRFQEHDYRRWRYRSHRHRRHP